MIAGMDRTRRLILGNVLVTIAMLLFTAIQVVTAYSRISVVQLLFCRHGLQLLFACLWWNIKKPTTPFAIDFEDNSLSARVYNLWGDAPFRGKIWLRGAAMAVTYPMVWYGVLTVPLGDYNCIYNIYPILTVYIAHFWLKEALPEWFILIPATILSLVGLLLVTQVMFHVFNMIT